MTELHAMTEQYSLHGTSCRIELETYGVTLTAEIKQIPASEDEAVIHGTGSQADFEDLKLALGKRLAYTDAELTSLQTYEQSLSLLLSKLAGRLRSGLSGLMDVVSLHSLWLGVDRQRFVMNAIFDGDVEGYFDTTLDNFGPLIDLAWRHCRGYPGAQPDGTYSPCDRANFMRWLSSVTVDPKGSSSFLYVRQSNFQGRPEYHTEEDAN